MKIQGKEIPVRIKSFLKKEYHGDGRYFIYKNRFTNTKTAIYDLQEFKDGLVEIVEEGSKFDKYTKLGKYLEVKFTKKFYDIFGEELKKVWGSLYSENP